MTKNFAELGLSEAALKAVAEMKYTDPTPVQEQAIPLVLQGRDVCAAAATGTGKTAAFLLPTMSTLPRAKKGAGPHMLVVTPTRELAQQIGDVCFAISRQTRHFQTTVYGGTKYGPQISKLKRGVDILIATPGRLNDLRDRGVVNLREIEVLVIDEADRMLDMGFWPSMESIIEETPTTRQTLLFSATLDKKVLKFVSPILKDPTMVEIAHHGETAKTVDQYMMPIEQRKKQELLQAVLAEKGAERVIVFARTKNRTEECMEQLRRADFSAESIHSDKSQFKRRRALENFSKGKTSVLVATDVLARGIDVSNVNYVVNYDLPDMAEDYVHRIGRTGRAGEAGFAISFVSRETRGALRDVERLIGREIPMMDLERYDLDPTLLQAKNKKSKQKRVRERDVERARAHKAQRFAGEEPAAKSDATFHGLPRSYKGAGRTSSAQASDARGRARRGFDGEHAGAGRAGAVGRGTAAEHAGRRAGRSDRSEREYAGRERTERRGSRVGGRAGEQRDNSGRSGERAGRTNSRGRSFDGKFGERRGGRDFEGRGRADHGGRNGAGRNGAGRGAGGRGAGHQRSDKTGYGRRSDARRGERESFGGGKSGYGTKNRAGNRKQENPNGFYRQFTKKG